MKRKMLLLTAIMCFALFVSAQDEGKQKAFEIYGFAMADVGYNFDQINPNWFDALRINRLPKYKDQFAPDGQVFFGIRQSTFGVRGYTPTPLGELKTRFEFDLFGVGADEGQTTMRLRHVYGEMGKFLAGQTHSPFMDADLWPNTIEYWGPTGMVFYRNVLIRFAPVSGQNEVHIALERPGASADKGPWEDRIELDSVRGRLKLPDLSAHYRRSGNWGHVQLSGMLRQLRWEDIHTTGGYDLSGSTTGWGLHVSTVLNLGKKDVLRASVVYGEGIQNYMQDAPVDVGVVSHPGNPSQPLSGETLPILGTFLWLDHTWNEKFSSSLGYSSANIDNTSDGAPDAYKTGQYAMANLLYYPFTNAMVGVELQWGRREGEDGFTSDAVKIHFAFKYKFAHIFYRDSN